ncbi:MAG: aromatic amino acid ammonia-lyase [Deltaproteobacteria bacterium]|nr:aromatic amino acid ammonia-lyase [Deltaproteobacteria bacterium]
MGKDEKQKEIREVVIGEGPVSLGGIVAVARRGIPVRISGDEGFRERMEGARRRVYAAIEADLPVYGVTTGYGKSCGNRLKKGSVLNGGADLMRFHGCGTGEPLGVEETRAAMICRMLCLARGYSGVSIALLDHLAAFLNTGITPIVPCEGSVGASGDLTPLSYILAALAGEREVRYGGKRMPAERALRMAKMKPYRFGPKEPLALINGTSVMTGIAAVNLDRACHLLEAASGASALSVHALLGKADHYHRAIGEAKPFPGQIHVAGRIRQLLTTRGARKGLEAEGPEALQDPYSLRCAPQILGVLCDALVWIRTWVEIEANSANDNPLFAEALDRPLTGGNFYGGHIAFAMDALKAALASAADMADRQVALLVNPNVNRGLPADLVRVTGEASLRRHGFKAMSITASALTAEALKATMPAASFSRSTESHNQDKVSMGTIAARDASRVCTLAERVAAIHLLAAAQACEIRGRLESRPRLEQWVAELRRIASPTLEDRPMDADIEAVAREISENGFPKEGEWNR